MNSNGKSVIRLPFFYAGAIVILKNYESTGMKLTSIHYFYNLISKYRILRQYKPRI